ncbi:hypothetical protein AB3662_31180 [Sorangium cellulosum]|uniref:hypothetical protein n=1 Tax=Sorangium cellulosum TaxID=56 RepID=UPI003D9A98B2
MNLLDLGLRRLAACAALTLGASLAAASCQLVSGIDGMSVDDTVGGVLAACGPVGTPCGGTCENGEETPPGICTDDGRCSAEPRECGLYDCDPSGAACATSCLPSGAGCIDRAVCQSPSATCTACGSAPEQAGDCSVNFLINSSGIRTPCNCNGETCELTCDDEGGCAGSVLLDTMKSPVVLDCGDQCNGAVVTCMGPYPCEVVCNSGGCQDLTLRCSQDGKCTLKCTGTGCAGNVTVECGTNFCTVACGVPNDSIHRECGSSCSCPLIGCD